MVIGSPLTSAASGSGVGVNSGVPVSVAEGGVALTGVSVARVGGGGTVSVADPHPARSALTASAQLNINPIRLNKGPLLM